MSDVVQFQPAPNDNSIGIDTLREAAKTLAPEMTDEAFDKIAAGFAAMKRRVNTPSRRIGGPMTRCGPVLFDPVQYRP